MMTTMTSSKPYLLRAMYDWIVDNDLTPYVAIDASFPNVSVPDDFIQDGHIVLNISPDAVRGLHIDTEKLLFTARFSGEAQQIFAPPEAIMTIYAQENGRGMLFGEEDNGDAGAASAEPPVVKSGTDDDSVASQTSTKSKPELKVVK